MLEEVADEKTVTEEELQQRFAIGRATMVYQAAVGEWKPKAGELDAHFAGLISYLKTGTAAASPEADLLVEQLTGKPTSKPKRTKTKKGA